MRSPIMRSGLGLGTSALAVIAGLGLLAVPVAAQEQASTDENADRNVIVVTAQFRTQNIQDTPLSITAVTGEMLEARSQTNITQLSAQTPNLLLQQNPSGSGNSMRAFIRGVGQSDQSPSVEPGVGIYIDDVYFGTITASAFDLVDLDRVEVLRGPQGTLAGMNSQGGAVKLFSKKPQGEGGYVEATIGNFNRHDLKASADFALVPDAVFARVSGVYRNRDGLVDLLDYACVNPSDPDVVSGEIPRLAGAQDCKVGELGDQDVYGVRGSIRIAPVGSPLEVNLIADYTRDRSMIQASTLIASAEYTGRQNTSVPYQGVAYDNRFVTYGQYRRASSVINDPFVSYANFYDPGVTYEAADANSFGGAIGDPNGPFIVDPQGDTEVWGVSGTVDFELGENLALKSITGYRTYDSVSGNDNDNSPVVFIQSQDWFTHEQFSQELRLSGDLVEDRLHFTVGGIYYDASTRYLARIHTPFSGFGTPSQPTFSFLNDDTSDMKVLAGFGNLSFEVTDRLTLEGGIRVTDEQKDYHYGRYNPDGNGDYLPISNPINPLSGQTGTYKQTITDYRAVAQYAWTDDVMTYLQFATGHKAGGVAPRPYHYRQIRPFGAEKLRSYEAGFKSSFADRRVTVNGDVFYMEYVGYQGIPRTCLDENGAELPAAQGGIPGLCGQYLNIGDAHVKGFELETFIEPVDGFQLDGSLSLTDFTFTSINYPTTSIVVGSSRPGIGKWKWSAGAQYEVLLPGGATVTPRLDVSYTPGYCGNFTCEVISQVDSHTLLNGRITYVSADEDWTVALEMTNITDELYYQNKFTNTWYATGQFGRPREYALTVRRKF